MHSNATKHNSKQKFHCNGKRMNQSNIHYTGRHLFSLVFVVFYLSVVVSKVVEAIADINGQTTASHDKWMNFVEVVTASCGGTSQSFMLHCK